MIWAFMIYVFRINRTYRTKDSDLHAKMTDYIQEIVSEYIWLAEYDIRELVLVTLDIGSLRYFHTQDMDTPRVYGCATDLGITQTWVYPGDGHTLAMPFFQTVLITLTKLCLYPLFTK